MSDSGSSNRSLSTSALEMRSSGSTTRRVDRLKAIASIWDPYSVVDCTSNCENGGLNASVSISPDVASLSAYAIRMYVSGSTMSVVTFAATSGVM